MALLAGYPACSGRQEDKSANVGESGGKSGTAKAGSSGKAGSKAQHETDEAGAGGTGADSAGRSSGGEVAVAPAPDFFALGSVVIDAEGARTTYLRRGAARSSDEIAPEVPCFARTAWRLGLGLGQLLQDFVNDFVFRHAFGFTFEASQDAVPQSRQRGGAHVVD